ncbi:MAG: VWA domain-containing protein, partial [Chloroflexi bacterium]|nr:VWA domain-containing protein [Chloroflexota bacterium]
EPDMDLVATLLSLKKVMPTQTRETAKQVVRQVVEDLQKRLEFPLRQAISGSLNRALRTRRPKQKEINWQRTIYANLKHYQPEYKTVVPEKLVGYGRKRSALRDVILAMDTSGSMTQSVVYASIYGAVMASIEALSTKMVVFDTSVVDLSAELSDPVDMLFGMRLGGGTNIGRAMGYCQQLVTRPRDTILILISDLYEGGNAEKMLKRTAALVADGVQVIVLLALNDQGAPRFNRQIAQELVDLGVPSFACTPDLFPDLMAAAINGRDIRQWAAAHDIVTAPSN